MSLGETIALLSALVESQVIALHRSGVELALPTGFS